MTADLFGGVADRFPLTTPAFTPPPPGGARSTCRPFGLRFAAGRWDRAGAGVGVVSGSADRDHRRRHTGAPHGDRDDDEDHRPVQRRWAVHRW